MKKEQQKEFLKNFLNPSNVFSEDSQLTVAKNIQNDIMNTLGSEFSISDSEKAEDINIDSFFSVCEEMSTDPIEAIESFLSLACKDIKNFDLNGKDVSLEALPDFFKKAKENFIKQKESEDINNF